MSLSRQRFHIYGILFKGELYYEFYEKVNSEIFCDFLEKIHKKYGKVLLFVDNTSWHKSKKTREKLEELGGDIVLQYFLPYTPQLNPIETQWRSIRKSIGNRIYPDLDEMKESICRMLGNGECVTVKMSSYLVH